jgi:hypothetical protein
MAKRHLAAGVLILLTATGCATDSPRQQTARERKAAGVVLFRIHCSKDLWTRAGSNGTMGGGGIPAKVTDQPGGLVTVELSGPHLVDLLKKLDSDAHGGWGQHDPTAIRMYDAIAPRVDAIQPNTQAGTPVPEVTINDTAGAPSTPAATSTPK